MRSAVGWGASPSFSSAWGGLAMVVLLLGSPIRADNAAAPGEVIQEYPTFQCLGVRWLIGGDENGNARVGVEYRRAGTGPWRRGLDLFRVETRAILPPNTPPPGQTLYAGSVFGLEQDAEYEVKE